MKIAKVLMVVLAVSLCCATANAGGGFGNDCSDAIVIPCNGSGIMDPGADATPTGPLGGACVTGGGVNDVWATFVATDVNARLRTDAGGSVGTDSDYVVYSVDQADVCDAASWVEIGCSEDDSPTPSAFLGDISIGGLTVGDTYLVQLGSWGDVGGSPFTLDIACPTVGGTCGDGLISIAGDEECDGANADACILSCDADCTCAFVPTPMLPKWGLIGLAMMLLVGGVAVFGRGRMGVQQA